MEKFIRVNFSKMTNRQLADGLGLNLTVVRMKCYEMGLKRMEMEYFTEKQTKFLCDNYKTIGDKELAEIFNKRFPKNKPWTHKHIEKKLNYLKLKRTRKQIVTIHQRNVDRGAFSMCVVKRWATTGQAKEGEIRMWRSNFKSDRTVPMIKIKGKFISWSRYTWEKRYGSIPKGMNVVFKDNDPNNAKLKNLELITDAELSKRNSKKSSQGLSDNYVAGMLTHGMPEMRELVKQDKSLINLKRKQLQLNRTINEQIKSGN